MFFTRVGEDRGHDSFSRRRGELRVAIDSGPVVNPERVKSQLEGAVVMGMGLSLMSKITSKNGKAVQNNFDGYEILRIDAAPKVVNVHIVPNDDWTMPLGGVGEPGMPPVAPTITNAIFAATGHRIRELPIGNQRRTYKSQGLGAFSFVGRTLRAA